MGVKMPNGVTWLHNAEYYTSSDRHAKSAGIYMYILTRLT